MNISDFINGEVENKNDIWNLGDNSYWSLVKFEERERLVEDLSKEGSHETIIRYFPQWEDLVFSPKRAAGIGMLDFKESDIVVDIGCMWGALTIPIARTNCQVIGIDQTKESLLFLRKRIEEEGLKNVDLVCTDAKTTDFKDNSVDKFIVNGVLEWIPESLNIAIEKNKINKDKKGNIFRKIINYYKRNQSPLTIQEDFLKKLNRVLKKDGILYLAIENRFDISYFFGSRDPHTGLRFINILPRALATLYSFLILGRPYLTWLYSEKELKKLLSVSGFSKVEVNYAFPDYRFPELILSSKGMDNFHSIRYRMAGKRYKKLLWWLLETIFYKTLELKSLSPAFIVIAHK